MTILHGDCVERMRELPDASVDSVVTDPPYGLEFMGKAWDSFATVRRQDELTPTGEGHSTSAGPYLAHAVNKYVGGHVAQAWHEQWAREAFRVLKPGGHLLAFGGTRTYHRLAAAIEDSGFEIRDTLVWAYASGFPKSLDVSKALDKARGDNPDWQRVGVWLKERREEAGFTRQSIAPLLSSHKNLDSAAANMSNWENGLSFPTWERWEELRRLIGFGEEMDAEVWRLNGRKGKPGEAWDQREKVGERDGNLLAVAPGQGMDRSRTTLDVTAPATDLAKQWQGWGTALKPAWEPIVMARKPLIGSVAQNVTAYGTGAINVDGCRIGTDGGHEGAGPGPSQGILGEGLNGVRAQAVPGLGRWPANVVLTDPIFDGGVDGVVGGGQTSSGILSPDSVRHVPRLGNGGVYGDDAGSEQAAPREYGGDSGTYSRFFLIPKAARADREPALRGQVETKAPRGAPIFQTHCTKCGRQKVAPPGSACQCAEPEWSERGAPQNPRANFHPTVKPTELMRHLVRLVTPPGGVVLDCFAGSGTTALACELEGFNWIAIEREAEYVAIMEARLNGVQRGLGLDFGPPQTDEAA